MGDPSGIWRSNYLHPTPWDVTYEPMSIPAMFDASVAAHPGSPLIDFFGRKFSYAEVADGASRVAHGLLRLGVQPGDRIGLFLPNVPHYVAAYYGAMKR